MRRARPLPRASSGSFVAPKSRTRTARMIRSSVVPRPPMTSGDHVLPHVVGLVRLHRTPRQPYRPERVLCRGCERLGELRRGDTWACGARRSSSRCSQRSSATQQVDLEAAVRAARGPPRPGSTRPPSGPAGASRSVTRVVSADRLEDAVGRSRGRLGVRLDGCVEHLGARGSGRAGTAAAPRRCGTRRRGR